MKYVSELPAGATGIAKVQSSDEIADDLARYGVNICEASHWNAEVDRNSGAVALPKSVNSMDFIEIENQNPFSSCFAVALTSVADRQYFQKTKEVRRFAAWPTYMLGQMETNRRGGKLYGEDGGTVPSHGITVANKIGFLFEDELKQLLPAALVRKWGGSVYPTGYNHRTAARGYREACQAMEPIIKQENVRARMYENRMETIIRARRTDEIVQAEKQQTATALECHVWTPECDNNKYFIETFSGRSRGGQHGHHATYIYGIDENGQLLKANSWSPELWGFKGGKTWRTRAHNNMTQHKDTWIYLCSNMSSKPIVRLAPETHQAWV